MKRKILETLIGGKVMLLILAEVANTKIVLGESYVGHLNICYVYPEYPSESVEPEDAAQGFKKVKHEIDAFKSKHRLSLHSY